MSLCFANTALVPLLNWGHAGLAMVFLKLFPGLYCFTYAITVYLPLEGVLAFYSHSFVVTVDRCGNGSVHGGLTS